MIVINFLAFSENHTGGKRISISVFGNSCPSLKRMLLQVCFLAGVKKREMTKEERRSNSVIKNSVRLQATLDGRKEEWNKIAHVLNKLFMILYTTSFVLLSVMLLASAVW